jgi:hypothetical protein
VSSLHSPSTIRRSTPSRRSRAGLATAAVVAVVAPLAAACGAGFNSAALDVKPNAGAGSAGAVKVNNVWVIVDPTTGNAEVIGAVANTGTTAESVTGVQVGDTGAQIRLPSGPIVDADNYSIDAGQSVSFGEQNQPVIAVAAASLTPGKLTPVSFSFGDSGSVTVTAQIQSDAGLWAGYDPNAANTISPALAPAPGAGVSASASASPSATK